MGYRWKPNASQRREFAERMKDHDEREAYETRKREKAMYDNWKDKDFVPTREQFDFCWKYGNFFETREEQDARNFVMSAYTCNEKVNHAFIHIVNEKRRGYQVKLS